MSFKSSPHDCHVRSTSGAINKYSDLGLTSELPTELVWSSDSEVEAGKAPGAILICSYVLERHSCNVVQRKEGGPDTTQNNEVSKLGPGSYVASGVRRK